MGRRGVRWLVIAAVALVAVLIAGDRIGVVVAEGVAADTLQSSQHLPSSPDVDIGGFPFLTQLATGHYDEITVTVKDVPLRGPAHGLVLSRLRVVLHHLSVSRSFAHFHAESADATALITYGELGDVLGVDLSYAGDGRVQATKSVSLAGHTLHARITATPRLDGGRLGFTGTSVSGVAGLPSSVVDAISREFRLSIPLDGIPFEVQLQDLAVGPAGATLTLTGSDLTYDKSGRAPH